MIRVWYHAGCNDGFAAALAAWIVYGDAIEYQAVKYGEEMPPYYKGDTIFIVDFSYPRREIERLRSETGLIILDHHKTAEEDLKGLSYAVFDMNKSGAMLSWEFFHPNISPPDIIKYVQDRDLWKFELSGSKAYSQALMATPFSFEIWKNLSTSKMISDGEILLRAQEREIHRVIESNAYMAKLFGYYVPVINVTNAMSDVLHELCNQHPEAPFAAGYTDLPHGVRSWSLRSNDKIDVSELARIMLGGGHKNAAGFQTRQHSHLEDVSPTTQ